MVHSTYFERAPVIERVLGVQFQPIPGLHAGLLGAFWRSLGDEWPNVSDAPPLQTQFERFGPLAAMPPFPFPLFIGGIGSPRLQILNLTGDRMIQVQNGRFHLNWKGQSGEGYTRYPELRSEFERYLRRFVEFLPGAEKSQFAPNQWEITYLNHIPQGTVWQTRADLPGLFRAIVVPPAPDAPIALETFGGKWQYEIPPQRGRLHAELAVAQDFKPTPTELLIFTLTARGPIGLEPDTNAELLKGLDLGSDTIVWAFKEFTSKQAHDYWGLRDGNS